MHLNMQRLSMVPRLGRARLSRRLRTLSPSCVSVSRPTFVPAFGAGTRMSVCSAFSGRCGATQDTEVKTATKGSQQCAGCGVPLQSSTPDLVGFVPDSVLARSSVQPICQRCHQSKNYGKLVPLKVPVSVFRDRLEKALHAWPEAVVVVVVDACNFHSGFIPDLPSLLSAGDRKVILAVNKVGFCDDGGGVCVGPFLTLRGGVWHVFRWTCCLEGGGASGLTSGYERN